MDKDKFPILQHSNTPIISNFVFSDFLSNDMFNGYKIILDTNNGG